MTGILAGLIGSFKKAFSWTAGTITAQVYTGAVYANLANGKYFVFGMSSTGGNTSSYRYSTDGVTWSTGTLPASSQWIAAGTNGSRIVVTRVGSTTGYYSDNGTTWTVTGTILSTGITPKQVFWDGARFIAADTTTARFYYSTNGTGTWTASSRLDEEVGSVGPISYDGSGRYIVLDGNTTSSRRAATATSFPGTWTEITLPTLSIVYKGIAYGAGIWVVTAINSTSYATSTNGTTWTGRTLPAAFGEDNGSTYAKLLFTNNKFYYYRVNNVYSSTDGINWVTEATITGETLDVVNGWAAGDNKIIGVGWDTSSAGSGVTLIGQ